MLYEMKTSIKSCTLVGMVQVYSDNTATTLNTNMIVAYPVHVLLLNFTKEVCQLLMNFGHTLVGLLHSKGFSYCTRRRGGVHETEICFTPTVHVVLLSDDLSAMTDSNGRPLKVEGLHVAMRQVLSLLNREG